VARSCHGRASIDSITKLHASGAVRQIQIHTDRHGIINTGAIKKNTTSSPSLSLQLRECSEYCSIMAEEPARKRAKKPETGVVGSTPIKASEELCEECKTKPGKFICDRDSQCCRYGSSEAEQAEEDGIQTGAQPHHTGRRCEDCFPTGKTYCGVCDTFQCYSCTQADRQGYEWHPESDLKRSMKTCSYCAQRACHCCDETCYYRCTCCNNRVVCKICLATPALQSAWTYCLDCEDDANPDCFSGIGNSAICPDCEGEACGDCEKEGDDARRSNFCHLKPPTAKRRCKRFRK
jgi:hypothetical protein